MGNYSPDQNKIIMKSRRLRKSKNYLSSTNNNAAALPTLNFPLIVED